MSNALPEPPHPIKPGYKTSEFWKGLAPMLVGAVVALVGLFRNDQNLLMLGLGVLGVGAVPATSYSLGRSSVKKAEMEAQTRYAEAVARQKAGGTP